MKKILLVLLSIFLFVACGDKKVDNQEKKIELSFWNPFGGPDAKTMNKLIGEFNEANKGKIFVKPQSIDNAGGAYYEKLRIANQSGSAPDVAIMHIENIPLYATINALEEITSEDLNSINMSKENFIPAAWEGTEFEQKRFAIPLDVHPMVLWYNKDLIKEEDIPKTLEEITEKSKTFNKDGKYLFAAPNNPFVIARVFYAGLIQNGGTPISQDGKKALYTEQSSIETLEKLARYSQNKDVNPPLGADVVNMFKQGKIAMTIEGIWMLDAFKTVNAAAVPWSNLLGTKKNAMWASSHTFVISKQKNEISPEKRKAILEFINYISKNSLEWSKAGQIPANVEIHKLPEFKSLEVQNKMAENLNDFSIMPSKISFPEIWSPIERVSNEVILGKKSASEGLNGASKEGEAKAEKLLELTNKK